MIPIIPAPDGSNCTGLYAFAPEIELDVAQTPALVDAVMTHFINMSLIQQWLMKALH